MKRRKTDKFLSTLLVVGMLLSITFVTASAEQIFTDVSEDAWYSEAVYFCKNWNLMNGTGDEQFSPDATLTRAMIVTILYRWEATPDVSELENPFSDVPEDMWYTDAVKWAVANEIVNGYGDGTFGPDDAVTKEQVAVFIYRASESSGMVLPDMDASRDFDDLHEVSDWADKEVTKLNEWGVFVSLPDTNFSPQRPATRAEVASILYRYVIVLTAANDGIGEGEG